MPLKMEVYNTSTKSWIAITPLQPGKIASFSNNRIDGIREMYLAECAANDSYSKVYRANSGTDKEIGGSRIVSMDIGALELLKTLKRDEEPYTMLLRSDISNNTFRQIRLTHV